MAHLIWFAKVSIRSRESAPASAPYPKKNFKNKTKQKKTTKTKTKRLRTLENWLRFVTMENWSVEYMGDLEQQYK